MRYELELCERTTRVEEVLKHQKELMLTGFAQIEKRFEQVDKRFEKMHLDLNIRFEQMDKKLEQMRKETDLRFEMIDKKT